MKFQQLNTGQTFILMVKRDPKMEHVPEPVFVKTPRAETRIPGHKEPHTFNAINLPAGVLLWLSEEQEVLPIAFQYND